MLLFTIVCTISKHKRHIEAENIAKREEVEEEELVPFAFYSIHKEMRIRENSFSLAAQTFKQVFLFRFHFLNLLQINSL